MKRLYFLWDYDLDEKQISTILHGKNKTEKLWLTAKILTHAKFEDIWKYLTVKDIVKIFEQLRLPISTKKAWQNALNIWGYNV